MNGEELHAFAKSLWHFNRSLTGDGVRETLAEIQKILPGLTVHEVPSGTSAFDWTVPREWRVKEAYIKTPAGEKIADFVKNNLHLVGYSVPIRASLSLAELDTHLYSLPEQPDAIPYITSYYQERWGFCLTENERQKLEEGQYEVVIDAELFEGNLTYADLVIPGESAQEVLLSTYVCHPSMANNELSGPVVATGLAQWLQKRGKNRLTYRFVFVPETIGSIVYLSRHVDNLKRHVIAGFNISCVGDDRAYSYLPSRRGDTLSDKVATHVLKWIAPDFKSYSWSERGSDERQYCAPKIDLPIASIMRTKYGQYPEYHTSLDDLKNVVTPNGLAGGMNVLQKALEAIDRHCYPEVTVLGEPQLGKRGLYPNLSTKTSYDSVRLMMDLITWSDGRLSLLEIAEQCKVPIWQLYPLLDLLCEHGLVRLNSSPS